MVEEGPVQTAAMENSRNWAGNFDMLAADQKTQELFGRFAGRMQQRFLNTIQTSNEIAEIVKSVILSEKPNLRYQTNEKYSPQEVKAKLTDPTGNSLVEMVKKAFLDEEEKEEDTL